MVKENIKVLIRFRPVNKREVQEQEAQVLYYFFPFASAQSTSSPQPSSQNLADIPIVWDDDPLEGKGTIQIPTGNRNKVPLSFTFDGVIGPKSSQEEAFDTIGEHLCDHVLQGYNCTLFVYGQTGSGTYFPPSPSLWCGRT